WRAWSYRGARTPAGTRLAAAPGNPASVELDVSLELDAWSLVLSSLRPQLLRPHWQSSHALAGHCKNCVGERGRDGRHAGFARAAHAFFARDDVRFDLRHFVHAQHRIIVKIPLLHASFLECDFAIKRGGEREHSAAFNLRADGVRVHHRPALDRPYDAVHSHPAVFGNRRFDHVRKKTSERFMHRDAATASFGDRLS